MAKTSSIPTIMRPEVIEAEALRREQGIRRQYDKIRRQWESTGWYERHQSGDRTTDWSLPEYIRFKISREEHSSANPFASRDGRSKLRGLLDSGAVLNDGSFDPNYKSPFRKKFLEDRPLPSYRPKG